MTRKRRIWRILLWVGAGLIVLVAAGAGVLSVRHEPAALPARYGQASSGAEGPIRSLGSASDPSRWRVGRDIELFHFEQATGEPILMPELVALAARTIDFADGSTG